MLWTGTEGPVIQKHKIGIKRPMTAERGWSRTFGLHGHEYDSTDERWKPFAKRGRKDFT